MRLIIPIITIWGGNHDHHLILFIELIKRTANLAPLGRGGGQ